MQTARVHAAAQQERVVVIARDDEVDLGARDHGAQVAVEGLRRLSFRLRSRNEEIASRRRLLQDKTIRIAADEKIRGIVVHEAAHQVVARTTAGSGDQDAPSHDVFELSDSRPVQGTRVRRPAIW